RSPALQGESVAIAGPMYLDTFDHLDWSRTLEAGTHQPHSVAARRQAREQLEKVNLRAPRLGVAQVLPVDRKQVHSTPRSRATRSSTPLMNAGARAPPNRCAIQIASSIATRGGVTPSSNS